MSDDIVARLREEGFITHMAKLPRESKILHAAADEIERLRAGGCARDQKTTQFCSEAVTLQRERDEARRMVVNSLYKGAASKQSIARSLGWKNLFNENSTDMEGDVE